MIRREIGTDPRRRDEGRSMGERDDKGVDTQGEV